MKLVKIILYPGTFVCKQMGIDPDADAGLIRWMMNTCFYIVSIPIVVALLLHLIKG